MTFIISFRNLNFPISWWNLFPQFFTQDSSVWNSFHQCLNVLYIFYILFNTVYVYTHSFHFRNISSLLLFLVSTNPIMILSKCSICNISEGNIWIDVRGVTWPRALGFMNKQFYKKHTCKKPASLSMSIKMITKFQQGDEIISNFILISYL